MAPAAASRLHRSRQRYNRVCDRSRSLLEQGDFEEALRAATAIGDDTLQKQAPGRVVPESFTHGKRRAAPALVPSRTGAGRSGGLRHLPGEGALRGAGETGRS